jgi:hypothetical protein
MINRILFLAIVLVSCNPVKQVLSDKQKLDKVAKEVVKMGYCVNDTTIVVKSDTLIEMDTLTIIDEKPMIEVINDTVYVTKWKTNNITKSVTIHDTIKASNWLFLLIFIISTIILTFIAKFKRWL